jgi:TolB-like protein/DNA-binding winged helix-turn-helix (wHTH) protein/Tfp pilus assembly protein PilF
MESPPLRAQHYQFGVFTVDTRSGELRKHGMRVKLQERPFQLLVALIENPGEIVSRQELRQRLWPDGTFVDFDHSLSSAVNKLRSAIHDSAAHPRYVETVGRRGYRFVYPISKTAPTLNSESNTAPAGPSPEIQNKHRWMVLSLAATSLVLTAGVVVMLERNAVPRERAAIHSIAVLPLKNLSSDPEQEYFSEGLTDELITRLASLKGLRVISHTSVVQYEDSRKPLPVIAEELGVDAVVEGTVLRADGRVRITAQLIEARADRHIWAESYERDQRDILALQKDVSQDIADNIRLSLNPAEHQRLAISGPISAEAYDLYLKGRYFWNKRTADGFEHAIECFQQAINKDSNYARAYAGLADTYALMSTYHLAPQSEFLAKARRAALRALEIDPTLAEAHTSLALIAEIHDWDWRTADQEYRLAMQLNPNYATAHHWYAECLAFQGRFDEALAESERARQLDPHSLIIAADRAAILYFQRQYDRAIEQAQAVLTVEPNFPRAHILVFAYVQEGRFREALADIQDWRRIDDTPWTWAVEAYVYGRSGQRTLALQALATLRREVQNRPVDPAPMLTLANIGLGHNDKAIILLQKAYSEHTSDLTVLKVDPIYDPLRGDPRFQQLLRNARLN